MKYEIVAFSLGVGIGLGIGLIFANKAKKDKELELEELKDYYAKKDAEREEKEMEKRNRWEEIKADAKKSPDDILDEPKRYAGDKGDISKYHKYVSEDKYVAANAPLTAPSEDTMKEDDICVIPPSQFEENEDYDVQELTYYANDILADELDEEIDNYESLVGNEFMNYFGVYDGDVVYVVNHSRKTYYEIVHDLGPYNSPLSVPEES